MRIATWNVNSIKARLPFVLHWLDARKPDIACFQELKVTDEGFPHDVFSERGYRVYTHGQATWNGVAVVTREPAEIRQAGLPGASHAGARLLTVKSAGISVTSVYVPNGKTVAHEDFKLKLEFLGALSAYVKDALDPNAPTIIGGDFNIAPDDIDSHAPTDLAGHIFHTDAERAHVRELLGAGYVDMYRAANPDGRMFSWWDYRAGCFHKNQGLRIDLLLASPTVQSSATEVWIDRDYRKKKDGETPSDHAPVIAELRV